MNSCCWTFLPTVCLFFTSLLFSHRKKGIWKTSAFSHYLTYQLPVKSSQKLKSNWSPFLVFHLQTYEVISTTSTTVAFFSSLNSSTENSPTSSGFSDVYFTLPTVTTWMPKLKRPRRACSSPLSSKFLSIIYISIYITNFFLFHHHKFTHGLWYNPL